MDGWLAGWLAVSARFSSASLRTGGYTYPVTASFDLGMNGDWPFAEAYCGESWHTWTGTLWMVE